MRLVQTAIADPSRAPCIKSLSFLGGFEAGLLTLVALALIIGLAKGRFVLTRTASRLIAQYHKGPVVFRKTLLFRTLPLILLMMGLGLSLRLLNTPPDLHGAIDIAIGTALAQGGIAFVRMVATAATK
jgi:hypothetical protein